MNEKSDSRINLLLVEDDPDFSSALTARLVKRNINVVRVVTAEEAIDKLHNTDVHVIVSDIKLPGMDGIQFLSKVRETINGLPVIFITGYANIESAKEAVKMNATDYLLKPLETIDELLTSINKAVHNYKIVRQNKELMKDLQTKVGELEQSEHRYRDLFELASDISFTVDEKGIITSVNKKMEEITYYPRKSLIGKPAENFITFMEDKIDKISFQEVLSNESTIGMIEVKIATKEDKERLGEMGMRPIREGERITGAQCIIRDITNRKLAEQKLQKAYARLIETQTQLIQAEKMEAMGRMASGVAHEVKNPLGIIMQGVNYLENESLLQRKDFIEIFQMIKNNIKRADDIIRMFLDFSRVSKLEIKPKDINSILVESLKLIQHTVRLEDIKVRQELAKKLPMALVDEGKIEQVFINILLNAIQSMHNGGKLYIRTYLAKINKLLENRGRNYFDIGEQAIIVEIKDTGIGISKENMKKIFDPFFTTKGPQEGTGLGLSVTQNIIDMHRGIIEIQSVKDKGTKVVVTLRVETVSKGG
ncbi:MAG: response regulator [Candidatus Omnitrophota bacterium]